MSKGIPKAKACCILVARACTSFTISVESSGLAVAFFTASINFGDSNPIELASAYEGNHI